MKVFVKYYTLGNATIKSSERFHISEKVPVNRWCEVEKPADNIREYCIVSGYHAVYLNRDEFLTIGELRKQKIERICLKSEIE